MATHFVSVNKALSSQADIINHAEHCSVGPDTLATIGCAVGQQVRIIRNGKEYALYTVHEARQENPDNVVRMGLTGRDRLDADGAFDAVIDSQVPNPTLSEICANENSEFIERLTDNGRNSGLIVIAPHGGDIEAHTDEQAERVASQLAPKAVTCWRCKGWNHHQGGAARRWHITSTDINEKSFPLLNSVISRGFSFALAFHGMDDERILIGGIAPDELKQKIKNAIESATAGSGIPVDFATTCDHFNGNDPRNIVNRLTANSTKGKGSIQIEQSLQARKQYGTAIADAVADVYRPNS
jgi:phage replication-related protein YjqB (UPF0714/DUF867 family)